MTREFSNENEEHKNKETEKPVSADRMVRRSGQLAQTLELISRFGLEEPEDIARAMRISVAQAKKLKRYIAKQGR